MVWGLQHVHWFCPLYHTGQYWRNDHYQTLQLSVTNWITWPANTSLVITLKWSVDVIIIINNMSTNKTTSNTLVHNLRYGWIYMYTPTPIITSNITGICENKLISTVIAMIMWHTKFLGNAVMKIITSNLLINSVGAHHLYWSEKALCSSFSNDSVHRGMREQRLMSCNRLRISTRHLY